MIIQAHTVNLICIMAVLGLWILSLAVFMFMSGTSVKILQERKAIFTFKNT